jgi:hypothetical protein
MPDLTNKAMFARLLGSFWSRIMTDRKFVEGISAASAAEVVRSYMSLVNAINRLSINTIDDHIAIGNHPVAFRRSDFASGPDYLRFGGGQVFGAQVQGGEFRQGATFSYGGLERKSESFYIGLDGSIDDIGMVLTNGVMNPSVTLVRGIDFVVRDGIIVFRSDPFDNLLIPQRDVFSPESGVEKEIVLWSLNAQISDPGIENQFGFAAGTVSPASSNYPEITRASLLATSGGPTMAAIDHLVAALVGLPCIHSERETVLSIFSFGAMKIVATDLGVYKIHPSLSVRPEISEGAVLERGHPLTTGTQIFDSKTNESWWSQLDGLVLSEAFLNISLESSIGFPNKDYPVTLSAPEQSMDGREWRSARFFIAGRPSDVDLFWNTARTKGLESANPTGNSIYEHLGIITQSGEPDFSKEAVINPLEFVASNVFSSGVVVVRIQLTPFFSLEDFFAGSEILQALIPAHLGLIVIIDISVDEVVLFQRQDELGVEPATVPLANTWDLVRDGIENFPSSVKSLWTQKDGEGAPTTLCPEAISADVSPDIGREAVSFGDKSENEVSYGAPIAACEESVESSIIPVCKP